LDHDDEHVPNDDTPRKNVLESRYVATAADRPVVVALVRRYYAAALAGDGAKACSMLYSPFAHSVAEDYGQAPGPTYLRGAKTCSALMSGVFEHFHKRLVAEALVLRSRVTARLKGYQGSALLSVGRKIEFELPVRHELNAWKVVGLLGFVS
jgi:hypothetical protein